MTGSAAPRTRGAAVVAVLVTLTLGPTPVRSDAAFTASATSTAGFGTGSLAPPPTLVVTDTLGLIAHLSWSIAPEAYATGYRLYRSTTSGSGHTLVASVTSRTTTTVSDTPLLPGTYYYILRTAAHDWLGPPGNEVSATLL